MGDKNSLVLALLLAFTFGCYCSEKGYCSNVTYDPTAIVIDGSRRVLQSGSIHYPRTTPEVAIKGRRTGLIETYVFWNYHEPVRGQYYFEGRFDLVRFIKTVKEAGLFVHLRIGPYACAEWNYGGFPMWLHFIPGIQFRTTNNIFKEEMKRFLSKIVNLMKEENLFASQGGPIILAQVENEYGYVEGAYGIAGKLYAKWVAETAVGLNTTVPWVMCQQEDAQDPIINTCNGFYCDQFVPNSDSKPKLWTENYSGWFISFGYPVPYRPVEDLAFAVARFFEYGGTFQNYYMYFGGTNFGRTAGGPLIATSYDYDAPIDEYGYIRQPKWGHLRDLHKAIKLCEDYLVRSSKPTHQQLGINLEVHIYYKSTTDCAAFLANYDSNSDANVTFNGNSYFLPAWSVSILPDCKNVIFNTAKIVTQRDISDAPFASNTTSSGILLAKSVWSWYEEEVGPSRNNSFEAKGLLEQINTTKDTSDFLWYSTSINVNASQENGVLSIESLGHAALVFVNKDLVGFGFGNHDDESFSITKKISLNEGNNTVDILSMIVGVQNFGPWFDVQGAGIYDVALMDIGNNVMLLSGETWTYQVGLEGEYLGLDNLTQKNSARWTQGTYLPVNKSLIWYKTAFLVPEGKGPLALNLTSMGKGEAWVNGQSIGRYWPAYLSPSKGCNDTCNYRGTYNAFKCQRKCGQPAQTLYHIPRTWVHPGQNLLVLHEELGGDPSKISVLTRTGQEICSIVSEDDPPPADSWKPNMEYMFQSPEVQLSCEQGWHITSINFASFGTPQGSCGSLKTGDCHSDMLPLLQKACLGQRLCSIPITTPNLGDPCPGVRKSFMVEALCSS
ncbi:hypothetical protein K2173_001609 [Erythroxylum novogranatense]|uniref:Beta-galactosidase n=1 Tax=Erythroxylum novogranatense TaxID=1862640 RepID=A0AAV8T539_9ROSI|nr:hypothetical protein K2173_001609 [Erythroxylum novogranatense]